MKLGIDQNFKDLRLINRLLFTKSTNDITSLGHIINISRYFFIYTNYLKIYHLTGCTASVFLEYIQRNIPEGVAMEVSRVGFMLSAILLFFSIRM